MKSIQTKAENNQGRNLLLSLSVDVDQASNIFFHLIFGLLYFYLDFFYLHKLPLSHDVLGLTQS